MNYDSFFYRPQSFSFLFYFYCFSVHCSNLISFCRYFPDKPQELRIGDDKRLLSSGLDFTLPTVIYFPPFFEGADGMSVTAVKQGIMFDVYNVK